MDVSFTLEDPETFKYVIPLTRNDSVDGKYRNKNSVTSLPKNSLKLMQEKVCLAVFCFQKVQYFENIPLK